MYRRGRQARLALRHRPARLRAAGVRRRRSDAGLLPGARARHAARSLIPTAPGVLSALGGLVADVKNDFISTAYYPLSADELPRLTARIRPDSQAARIRLAAEEQKFAGSYVLQPAADMRYLGQSFEIEVPLPLEWIAARRHGGDRRGFHPEHERLYGHSSDRDADPDGQPAHVVVGGSPQPKFPAEPRRSRPPCRPSRRRVSRRRLARACRSTAVRSWATDIVFASPCVVAQEDTTICVPAGFAGTVDAYGNILLVAWPVRATQCASIRSRCRSSPITRRRRPTAWPSRCSARPTRPS